MGGGEQPIVVDPEQAQVIIDDTNEPGCGEISVQNGCKTHKLYYAHVGPITVGYEFEVYTTTEGMGFVEICAVITQPPNGIAPRDFTVSSTTRDGTASKRFHIHVEQRCI